MPVTVITTPGAIDANSYCSLAEATTYHESHPYSSVWDAATTDSKNRALVTATRLLDELVEWRGSKNSTFGYLRWPRIGIYDKDGFGVDSETIPQFLKNATAEFARLLLAEDRTADSDTKGFKSIKVGPISLDIDKADEKDVLPESVFSIISHYTTAEVRGSYLRKVVRS